MKDSVVLTDKDKMKTSERIGKYTCYRCSSRINDSNYDLRVANGSLKKVLVDGVEKTFHGYCLNLFKKEHPKDAFCKDANGRLRVVTSLLKGQSSCGHCGKKIITDSLDDDIKKGIVVEKRTKHGFLKFHKKCFKLYTTKHDDWYVIN